MMPVHCLALPSLLIPALTLFGQPPAGHQSPFQSISYEQAVGKARRDNKQVMIACGATWCEPCSKLEAITLKNRRVEKFLSENAIAIKVDIDQQRDLVNKHNISSVPTMLFLDAHGKEVGRIMGYENAEKVLETTSKFVKN